jgi:hypothetical protein
MIANGLKIVLVAFSLIILLGCAPQSVVQPPPAAPTTSTIPPANEPTVAPPTETPIPAPATATFSPEIQATTVENVAGVWAIVLKDNVDRVPANFTLSEDGTFSIITTGPQYGGATVAQGPFWFEDDIAKFETDSCQNSQGEVFHCIFSYQLFVSYQDGKPVRLHMVLVDDPGVGKKSLDGKTFVLAEP